MEIRMEGEVEQHGTKRQANDALDSDQRLSKRLNLLRISKNGHVHIPARPPRRKKLSRPDNDSMHVDDTKNKVYIHDLDAELSDTDSEKDQVVFLPEIEKRLTKIPKSVLVTREGNQPNNEVVLYSVPSSLLVPVEKDSVRKAIIESRARVREQQAQGKYVPPISSPEFEVVPETTQILSNDGLELSADNDSMDID